MNLREETTTVINCLRTIEKQKTMIKMLKLSIKCEKKKHLQDIKKYSFTSYKRVNIGVSTSSKKKVKQRISKVFEEINKNLNKVGFGISGC